MNNIDEKAIECQMTVTWDGFPGGAGYLGSGKCGKPAKYTNPKPQMGVKYVCGIHARSLDKMYQRTGQNIKCIPLMEVIKK